RLPIFPGSVSIGARSFAGGELWAARGRSRLNPHDFLLFLRFLLGTFLPFLRASESPMAIACLRLLTFPPFPPLPRFNVPFFLRCMARFTSLLALFEYFLAMEISLPDPQRANQGTVPGSWAGSGLSALDLSIWGKLQRDGRRNSNRYFRMALCALAGQILSEPP